MISNRLIIFNIIAFQLLWWACVLSAKHGLDWLVLIVTVAYIFVHFCWIEPKQQFWPLILTAIIGCVFDQYLFMTDWIRFNHHPTMSAYIPLWMIALWLGFATTLNLSMHWLQHRLLLAASLGAVFGPLAYLGAQQLEAVTLTHPLESLVCIAIEWGLALPLLLFIRRRFDQPVEAA